jgi:hypothetical protein
MRWRRRRPGLEEDAKKPSGVQCSECGTDDAEHWLVGLVKDENAPESLVHASYYCRACGERRFGRPARAA